MIATGRVLKAPEGLRVYLYSALSRAFDSERQVHFEKCLTENGLMLGRLDRERVAEIDRRLVLQLDGFPMAANTASRVRIIARASVNAATEAGAVDAGVWPRRSISSALRNVARANRTFEIRSLSTPQVMVEVIDAIVP